MSKSIYAELVAAGAPELPEGYYYMIRDRSEYWPCIDVSVYRSRERWWDKRLGVAALGVEGDSDVHAVAETCERAWGLSQPKEPEDYLGAVRKYIGRHP